MGVQVGQILRQAARRFADRCALVDLGQPGAPRREFSFGQLDRMARRAAAQLQAAGIQRGDRVALLAENQAELVALWFGCAYAGAAVVPINVLAGAPELAQRVEHAGAKLIVHDAARVELAQRALDAIAGQTRELSSPGTDREKVAPLAASPATADAVADRQRAGSIDRGDPAVQQPMAANAAARDGKARPEPTAQRSMPTSADASVAARSLDAFDWQGGEELAYPVDCAPNDTALVLYTSGTTGKPKGAAISHASLLLHTMLLVQHALGLTPDDRVLCPLPLSHSYGCRLGMLAPFYAGARIVVMPRFEAERSFRALQDESISWLPAVPTMFAAWGQLRAAEKPSHLRWALCAGAPLALAVAERAEAKLGAPVRQGYGMTEATFCTIDAPPDERTPGSVGKPIWGIELRVVDDAGRDLPPGQSGEVLVRGHNVMTHYLFDAEATQDVAPDGWVRSGDVGRLDADGRLFIVDRIKDLIIRGGYNVYPSELESALGEHPGVSAVAVIGEPDEYYGERVLAIVVPSPGAAPSVAELQAFAAERLSRIKLPQAYAFVSELPLGASGKVEKRRLRDYLALGRFALERV